MKEYALFLGCTTPVRALNYELSSRKVAETLGIKLVDLDFGCCGFPIEVIDETDALAFAAKNLSLAKEKNLSVIVLCNACAEMLTKTEASLSRDEELTKKVNGLLQNRLGTLYEGSVPVKHFARFLHEDYGLEKLKKNIKRPLKGIKIAVQYGCHYMRPSEIYKDFDDPFEPRTLDELVEVTGAESVEYESKMDCCGGGIVGIDEKIAVEMTKKKILELIEADVDAMILICPYCGIMYDRQQASILEAELKTLGIPVLYYPQLLGLALGIRADELGFDYNAMNSEKLLEKIRGL
jgi:heterodisulfide reductase subunit B